MKSFFQKKKKDEIIFNGYYECALSIVMPILFQCFSIRLYFSTSTVREIFYQGASKHKKGGLNYFKSQLTF